MILLATTIGASVAKGDLGIDWAVLGIVMLGVFVLMLLVKGLGLIAVATDPASTAQPPVGLLSATPPQNALGIDATTIAVLTAAASSVLGDNVRVVEVSEVYLGNVSEQRAWAREGRREVYMSHRLRY